MSSKKKSKYADYFAIRNNRATCNKCGKIIQLSGSSTSPLLYHCKKVCNIKIDDPPASKSEKTELKNQSTLDGFVKVERLSKEEMVSREAALGATFNYVTKSPAMKEYLAKYGYNQPKHTWTVKKYIHTSAVKHRQIMREKLKIHIKNGHRFCALTDEWTCPVKKRKYLNVQLHLKGMSFLELQLKL